MTKASKAGSRPPHPETVACLRSLTAKEEAVQPPLLREGEDGFVEYRIEAEEVRWRRVDAAELDARDALDVALRAVEKDFGRRLAQLTGAVAQKAPDLDAVETFMRDSF